MITTIFHITAADLSATESGTHQAAHLGFNAQTVDGNFTVRLAADPQLILGRGNPLGRADI